MMGITASIWNFNSHSVRSIEECLGDLTCAFKSLQLLHGGMVWKGQEVEVRLSWKGVSGEGGGQQYLGVWEREAVGMKRSGWIQCVGKCLSTLGDVLGVGGKERRCKNDSQVSGLSNWVDGDNL